MHRDDAPLAALTAAELTQGFLTGELSPVEVLVSVRERVEASDGRLGACWAVDFDRAEAAARQAERRWRDGRPLSAIDGVPITIKEMIATAGDPRPLGTAAGDMTPAAMDAPPAARVREAGAVIWGKTTNPDFGMLSSGLSSFHVLARNPWDLSRTPGGSSAGAAAAAAAGYGPLHLGTDIGGSLRLPAGWCGVFTLKPSFGRVPIDPPFIGRVAGPITRTVEDAALLMTVLSHPDPRDFMSLPPAEIDFADLTPNIAGLRIGVMQDAGCGMPVTQETASAIERAAQVFASAGATIVPVPPLLNRDMLDGLDLFWRTRFLSETRDLPRERYDQILPYIREWGEGAKGLDGISVYEGFSRITQIQEQGVSHFAGLDFLLSPVAPDAAFPAEWPSPTRDPAKPFEHIAFTMPYNMTGQPAASINCGFTAGGLPIGLQIVGARFDDIGVLKLAKFWEEHGAPAIVWPEPADSTNPAGS